MFQRLSRLGAGDDVAELGHRHLTWPERGEVAAEQAGRVEGVVERKKGDPLVVLEAMKMENIIKSPIDGKIDTVMVQKGDKVEKNSVLVEFQKSDNEI